MKNTVMLDLGGTLVEYYGRSEVPVVLEQAITAVQDNLRERGLLRVSPKTVWEAVEEEKHEASDYCVRPLKQRLMRVFQLDEKTCSDDLLDEICRCFLKPVFGRARRYDDALPVLQRLRSAGCRIAIVSNTAWGSPAHLWREELARQGLNELVDAAVFCSDVGWRKPAPQIFLYTLVKLGVGPKDCIFVGDDPRWDFVGPQAVGIEAILLDRCGTMQDVTEEKVQNLHELCTRLRIDEAG